MQQEQTYICDTCWEEPSEGFCHECREYQEANEPLFDRCSTLGQLAIILVAGLSAPILFLVHIVTTFYSATFNREDTQQ
jgi:hypothetical protein